MACGLIIDDGDEGYTTSPGVIQPIVPPSIINLPTISIGPNASANKWKDLHIPKLILSKLIENGINSPEKLIELFQTEQQLQQLCNESDPNMTIIQQRRFITSILKYKQTSKYHHHQKQHHSPLPQLSLSQSNSSPIKGSVIITEDESEGLKQLKTWTNCMEMMKQEISTEKLKASTDHKQLKDQFEEQINILKACIFSKLQQDLSIKLSVINSKLNQINEMQDKINQCQQEISDNMHSIFNIQDRKYANLKLVENTSKICNLIQSSLMKKKKMEETTDKNDIESSSNKIKEEINTVIKVHVS